VALLKPLNKFGRLERLDAEQSKPLPPLPAVVARRIDPEPAAVPLPVFAGKTADSKSSVKPAAKASKTDSRAAAKSSKSISPKPKPAALKKASVKPAPIVRESPARPKAATPEILDAVDAREIQKALRNTGFYSGPIDGILGPGSRKAVKDYQVLHELTPDGVVGPRTWASLRLYLDPGEA
jgi:peptidoglycan hydrolase-like protein with peptidoglycan-binding domain